MHRAGSDCAFLNSMVRDLLKEIWLKELSISEELLSKEEQLQIRFIFAGLVSVLGSPEVKAVILFLHRLQDRRSVQHFERTDIGIFPYFVHHPCDRLLDCAVQLFR